MAVTKRQREVLNFIDGFVRQNDYAPSFEEIGRAMGLSSLATVHKHISNLERKGLLRRDYNKSRSLDVVPKKMAKLNSALVELRLPLLGRIAAGQPLEALENPESISLADITRARDVYVLEVRGDSMQDEHIVEGDYVMIEKTNTARDGDIVVALVNGSDATLKRIYREGPQVRLQPSNAKMAPMRFPAQSVQVQGRVVGIMRKY